MTVHSSVQLAFLSLVIAFGAACSSSDEGGSDGNTPAPDGNGNGAEPAALNGITAAHNALRASVDPPAATPIPPLAWSAGIAAVAQARAKTCKFEHVNSGYGENLHANTFRAAKPTAPSEVVESWGSEADDYDYDANSCSGGKCGHYTQVVWAASRRLGCGVAQCTENSPFQSTQTWELWVCNYDPPGNFGDDRPY